MSTAALLLRNLVKEYRARNINAWLVFFLLVYAIGILKFVSIQNLNDGLIFNLYSLGVSVYILSRFALAYFHEAEEAKFDRSYLPTITFGVPSKNEEENIYETVMRIAGSSYPKDKFDIILVDDGSDDGTYGEMRRAQRDAKNVGVRVSITRWKVNRGKREGMAECVRKSTKDIVLFIDSDSFVETTTARELVKYFCDPQVSAVAGHGYVANAQTNALTKMQAVRYFVAFKAYKGAESLFGSVTCCSGCCSAYRRSAVMEILDRWRNQTFLGVRCTYGDDRSLTNYLLESGYTTLYAPEAVVHTIVPDTFRKYLKQQLRWKKSWLRENLRVAKFIWRRNIIMSLSFYLGYILPLLAPFVLLRAALWYPLTTGHAPLFYLIGLLLMALVYGLYYYIHTNDKNWLFGVLCSSFYSVILIWQLPYAMMQIRDARWGTR